MLTEHECSEFLSVAENIEMCFGVWNSLLSSQL